VLLQFVWRNFLLSDHLPPVEPHAQATVQRFYVFHDFFVTKLIATVMTEKMGLVGWILFKLSGLRGRNISIDRDEFQSNNFYLSSKIKYPKLKF
jgi:hypothetical protein